MQRHIIGLTILLPSSEEAQYTVYFRDTIRFCPVLGKYRNDLLINLFYMSLGVMLTRS